MHQSSFKLSDFGIDPKHYHQHELTNRLRTTGKSMVPSPPMLHRLHQTDFKATKPHQVTSNFHQQQQRRSPSSSGLPQRPLSASDVMARASSSPCNSLSPPGFWKHFGGQESGMRPRKVDETYLKFGSEQILPQILHNNKIIVNSGHLDLNLSHWISRNYMYENVHTKS
ncbi:hypothetical protein QAD02_015176 [Eretmocerus hayati]|uniref:Uncharacterized protein n=1 Tax=Eretmocerus hayati TaxID=131215 RepID=A0ACC2P738_9HYME|nr:hypothetical protein QAD02_015176 [Eretmocerus hayati]